MPSLFDSIIRLERAVGRLEPVVEGISDLDKRVRRLEKGAWMLAGMWIALTSGLLAERWMEAQHDHKPVAVVARESYPSIRSVPVRP